jgi:hypothetical protein
MSFILFFILLINFTGPSKKAGPVPRETSRPQAKSPPPGITIQPDRSGPEPIIIQMAVLYYRAGRLSSAG